MMMKALLSIYLKDSFIIESYILFLIDISLIEGSIICSVQLSICIDSICNNEIYTCALVPVGTFKICIQIL